MQLLKSGGRSINKVSGRPSGAGGFTMIELLVVIGIMSTLIGIAVTSYAGRLPKIRLQGAANDIVQKFQKARFSAIRHHRPTIVTLSNANDQVASTIAVDVDMDRSETVNSGDIAIDSVTIPSKYALAYIVSFNDCNTTADPFTITFGSKGTVTNINGGGRGAMPVIVILQSQVTTNPTTYTVIVERSGIARLVAGIYTPSC